MLETLIILSMLLTAQTDEEISPPITNDGEVFQDPFADESPVVNDDEIEVEVESEFPNDPPEDEQSFEAPDPFADDQPLELEAPVEPAPPAAPVESPSIQSPPIESPEIQPRNRFDFPEFEEAEGPVSQEVFRRQSIRKGMPEGSWQLSIKPGAGFNLNRRPGQVSLEAEVGYRWWKRLDFNCITNYRFIQDRILGFLIMPTWTFNVSGQSIEQWNIRVGLGTGWSLLGVSGAGFQFGYLPVRTDVQLIYYPFPHIGFFSSVGTETYLMRVGTDGKSINELAHVDGPPTQGLAHVGLRWEF